ncbi:hypothetical protein [Nocardia sp. NBC_00511]|uniref:hypothetical protein n=1 Tax=Nocardia sp. NBC_00511 TaxID=2903591 RepID=UPI002F918F77
MLKLLAVFTAARVVWSMLAALVVLIPIVLLVVVVMGVASTFSAVGGDFFSQCDTAVGPDPASTVAATPTTAAVSVAAAGPQSDASPAVNPYAQITFADDDTQVSGWMRACATAMRYAPYQSAPERFLNTGLAVDCAAMIAQSLTQRPDAFGADTDPAEVSASIIRDASTAAGTPGSCDGDPADTGSLGDPAVRSVQCPTRTATGTVVLPETLAVQSYCGSRVDPAAVSAGDLVFWGYENYAPTRVGVAIGPQQIVCRDGASGRMVQQALPTGRDVRIKRVLSAAQ